MIGKHDDMIDKIMNDVIPQWEKEEQTSSHIVTLRIYLEFFNVPMLKRIESFIDENKNIRMKTFIECIIQFDKILMNRIFLR